MSIFSKKSLPSEYQLRILANELTKHELQNLMKEYDLTATELNLVGDAFRTINDHQEGRDPRDIAFANSTGSMPVNIRSSGTTSAGCAPCLVITTVP